MAKRRIRRKKFECGHKGLGQYCHSCYNPDWGGKKYMRIEQGDRATYEKTHNDNKYGPFSFTIDLPKKKQFDGYIDIDTIGST
ncbi:hypothetical protein HYZ41_01225 [archaeon]|nr:hypothetical protein [archaeon]